MKTKPKVLVLATLVIIKQQLGNKVQAQKQFWQLRQWIPINHRLNILNILPAKC